MTHWRSVVPERESGQAVVEYALVLALVAAGLLIALLLLRDSIGGAYDRVADQVDRPDTMSSPETGAVSGGAKTGADASKDRTRAGKEH